MKVLIVDDEPNILEQIEVFLEKKEDNFDIETATSAQKGLDLLKKGDFDAVVSDYKMPEMNGIEFLETLREDRENDIPFIILTGKGDEEAAIEALNLGANRYLQKGTESQLRFEVLADTIVQEVDNYQMEEKLREYKIAVEETDDSIYMVDRDFRYIFANEEHLSRLERDGKISLRSSEEVVGKKYGDIHPEEDLKSFKENTEKVFQTGEAQTERYESLPKDRWSSRTYSPVKDQKTGEVNAVVVVSKDITEEVKAEEKLKREKERFEELFEGANQLIVTTDKDGYIRRVNKWAKDLTGYSGEDLKGKPMKEFVYPEDREKAIKCWKELADGNEVSYELRIVSSDGEIIHVTGGGTPIERDGEVVEIQYNGKDITDRVKAERRREFLHSLLRHDVKNKAHIVQGYLDLLKDTEISEKQEEIIEKAINGSEEGLDIIEKVETLRDLQEEEVEEVNVEDIIDNVVSENESKASEKGIKIENEFKKFESKVWGGELLKELFTNLVGNSIRHSEGNKIKISGEESEDEIIVKIEDDGKGIPDEEKDNIFKRGYAIGESRGTGLGMYLVKEIIKRYGGSIEVKDSELGGARFDVHLEKI